MNALSYAPPIVIVSVLAAWLLTRKRRRIELPEEIIARLKGNLLDNLEPFLCESLSSDDTDFWSASGRLRGMLDRRHNAICLTQLCQALVADNKIRREDLEYVSSRTIAISFFTALSLPEELMRRCGAAIPHGCARLTSQIYSEVEDRVRLLCQEHHPKSLELMYEVL